MRDIAIERDEAGRAVRLWFGRESTPADSGGVTRQQCPVCGIQYEVRRSNQRYCSSTCKDTAYNRAHPVARQARLDFTPASSELAHAVRGRETKASRILARLRQGPAGTMELAQIGGIRFGARLNELKARGLRWDRADHRDGAWEYSVYTMTQDVEGK